MQKKHTTDLTTGSVTKKLLLFFLPIVCSNILQHLYTATDRAVVGQFADNGTTALAAVGSTGPAITLLLGMFTGTAVGVNIVCSNLLGAKQLQPLRKSMHTALCLAGFCGIFMLIVGQFVARPMLLLINAPLDVIDLSTLYMRIYFLGVPFSLVYNFGSALLRAHGDTKRPMRILALSGLINVGLNLLLVIIFNLSVAGVAIATVVSQAVSAIRVVRILFDPKDAFSLKVPELKLHKKEALSFARIGIPCGFNGMAFSVSNIILQSTVNTFGPVAIAGNVAADGISGLIYQIVVSFYSACVSFTGQNFGARNYKRIDKGIAVACLCSVGIVLTVGLFCIAFSSQCLGIFHSDPAVIAAGTPKLIINCGFYSLYAISEVFLGVLRGMRKTAVPSAINIMGICLSRVLWIWLFFPLNPVIEMVYVCYPVSWFLSSTGMILCYLHYKKALKKTAALPAGG